jgi:hypothetical protein
MKTKIIRAYELQFRDVFIKQGYEYIVVKKDDDWIYYKNRYHSRAKKRYGQIGSKSMERVELIVDAELLDNPPPQKIKVYHWKTREFIGSYKNGVEAAKSLDVPGVTDSHISDYINKKFKNPNYNLGFHFEKTRN